MNYEPERAPLAVLLTRSSLVPATLAHHFLRKHRNTIYDTVKARRVKVTIIEGVEFVNLRELETHYQNTKRGPKPMQGEQSGQGELMCIMHVNSDDTP